MITRSNRIRWAETPDAPVPGVAPAAPATPAAAVPPVVPPVTPPAYATAPGAPAPGGPGKTSKGLIIGLIAGGGALVLIAIIAVVALVLPSLLGGGSDTTNVADIAEEPDTTWDFDYVGDNDEEYISFPSSGFPAVGDNQALVYAEFDYYAYQDDQPNSYGWYEGYDEHYETGYESGVQYNEDYEYFWDNYDFYTSDYDDSPDYEDYYPEGYEEYSDEWGGWDDGFWDGVYGEEGDSKAEKPVDPDYAPTLTLLDLGSGKETWTVDLGEAIDGVDVSSSFYPFDITGSDAVGVSTQLTDDEGETTYIIATLAKSDGKVLSVLESEDYVSGSSAGGDIIITTSDDKGNTTVGRYGVNALDDDAKWEVDGPDAEYGVSSRPLGDKWLMLRGDDEGMVLDISNGDEASFGDDIDEDVYYTEIAGQIIRVEQGKKGYELEGYNTNGDSTWKSAVDAEAFWRAGDNLLVSDYSDGEGSELIKINLSNGEEAWGDTWDEDFSSITGTGNSVLATSGSNIYVLDAGNGEEKFKQKVGDYASPYLGSNQYYVYDGETLTAFKYSEKGKVWEFDTDDDETITTLGKHFVLVDTKKGTIYGLG